MGAERVGQRIHVYWADETAWFSGVVKRFSAAQGYYVVYDDGDERWEGLNESYRFDGQQSSDDENEDNHENDEREEDGGDAVSRRVEHVTSGTDRPLTPRAMEPPGSDTDADTDGSDEDEGEGLRRSTKEIIADPTTDEVDGANESIPVQPTRGYPLPVELGDSNGETNSVSDDDPEEIQSVASTEVPLTHEVPQSVHQSTGAVLHAAYSRRLLPHRGCLCGFIKRATGLPLINNREEPRAYVRVSFIESAGGGEGVRHQPNMLMLRCKQVLTVTRAAPRTCHPVWNDVDNLLSKQWRDKDNLDGLFQLQVVPPMSAQTVPQLPQPAWSQLRGELLFSVYHQEQEESRLAVFIGQASLPLCKLMRDVFNSSTTDPTACVVQCIPLETRDGKSIRGVAEDCELVVQFQFEPEFDPDHRVRKSNDGARPEVTAKPPRSSTPSLVSSNIRPKPTPSGGAAKPRGRSHHQSSSEINRRRFEKQIESENKAMAKRVAEQRRETGVQAARRQQLNHQPRLTKSEPKPGVLAVTTAPTRFHKASSEINRAKFVDHIKRENKSMGRRLVERVGLADATRRRINCDSKTELDWDDFKAQDKAYVDDKRLVLRHEKDFLLEKAQIKYQEQNDLVEEVMALQNQVADLKTKLFAVRSNIQRVDAMNSKDSHVRDCLRRAAAKTKHSVSDYLITRGVGAETLLTLDNQDSDANFDPRTQQHLGEIRMLLQEASALENERQRLQEQVVALDGQEVSVEEEIIGLHRKWQFVQTKRAFQHKMTSTPVKAAHAKTELAIKKNAKETSAAEEEQYAIYQAQQELTQLQIAITVLRDRMARNGPTLRARDMSSSAVCDYLREKIERRKGKIQTLGAEQARYRSQYEELVTAGKYDALRAHVQELQHLLFLCENEAKHVAAAEQVAKHSKDVLEAELQRQRFSEQTETDILLKKCRQPTPR